MWRNDEAFLSKKKETKREWTLWRSKQLNRSLDVGIFLFKYTIESICFQGYFAQYNMWNGSKCSVLKLVLKYKEDEALFLPEVV